MRTIATIAAVLLSAASYAQTVDICDRTPEVRQAIMDAINADDCDAVDSKRLASVNTLLLGRKSLKALRAGDFDGLASLQTLWLDNNRLTTLPEGVFNDLSSLQELHLYNNRLTTLPVDVFDGLASLQGLYLHSNRLTTLPVDVFDGLASLQGLYLHSNQFTTLSDGVFDGLDSVQYLDLSGNQLTTLPDSVFDGFASLINLDLYDNQLNTLPAGVFDGLDSVQHLNLSGNQLTTLPDGVFDGLISLTNLDLSENHLVGLTRDDPLFAEFSSQVEILLHSQTAAEGQNEDPPPTSPSSRLVAAVPLMLSASNSRQGFVRIVNDSDESGSVRIFAVDDGGNAPNPFEIRLGARQELHFNASALENGNSRKGIGAGVGNPVEGDWRLDVETALPVRVMAFVRHADGFLTAMHDVLPRTDDGRLAAYTFNPGSNLNQTSRLRLVNTGENDADVRIEGVDGGGNTAGPVILTLPPGESRTLSAVDLESGARGLSGTLGDGEGKWRLFIDVGSEVVGMSLLESANGNLTNISTMGVATDG